MLPNDPLLCLLILLAALLYASVGHAGASGYLAAMALYGIAPTAMKPAALCLNILVASIASYKFIRARAFSWSIFQPLALTSIPFAYLGGLWSVADHTFKILIGLVLIFAAWRSFIQSNPQQRDQQTQPPSNWVLYLAGALLGLLSGLTGVGGGIFLSPLLLLMGWAPTRVISGVSALFILVNSIAGLLGLFASGKPIPLDWLQNNLPWLAIAAAAGGWLGAEMGSKRLSVPVIRKVLSLVLLVAGGKMLLTA